MVTATMSAASCLTGRSKSAGSVISGSMSTDIEKARHFYGDLLGFTVSDIADFSRRAVVSEGCRARRPARLFHALRHRPSRDGAVLEAGHGPPRRPPVRARGHDQPDHLAMRQPEGDRRGLRLFRGAAGPHPARRARHARQQLAHLCLRPGRAHQRILLRHRADRLEPGIEAARDVLSRVPREAGTAADVGGRRDRRGAGKRHRHFLRPSPGPAERRQNL